MKGVEDDAKYIHVNNEHQVIDVPEGEIEKRNSDEVNEEQLDIFSIFSIGEHYGQCYLSNADANLAHDNVQVLCRDIAGMPTHTEEIKDFGDPILHHCLWSIVEYKNGESVLFPLRAFALTRVEKGLDENYIVNGKKPNLDDKEDILVGFSADFMWIISYMADNELNFLNSLWDLNFQWMEYKADERYDQRRGVWISYRLSITGVYIITNANDWEYYSKPGEKNTAQMQKQIQ